MFNTIYKRKLSAYYQWKRTFTSWIKKDGFSGHGWIHKYFVSVSRKSLCSLFTVANHYVHCSMGFSVWLVTNTHG